MNKDGVIFDKRDLVKNYDLILKNSGLDINTLQEKAGQDKNILLQVSSGSSGVPIKIPRTASDIHDVLSRVYLPFSNKYGHPPQKIAMLGGISHMEVSAKLKFNDTIIHNFGINKLSLLEKFNPDVISCYPSVIREILDINDLTLNNLKAIKLGGETIFSADLIKIYKRFKSMLVIEQYGSTEMPAIALRLFEEADINKPYILQSSRFEFLWRSLNGWQPIIVRDNFSGLIFKIDAFYNTGDEGLIEDGEVVSIRRGNDNYYEFINIIDDIFRLGCTNVQVLVKSKYLKYSGDIVLPKEIKLGDINYITVKSSLNRIPISNKLPIFVDY